MDTTEELLEKHAQSMATPEPPATSEGESPEAAAEATTAAATTEGQEAQPATEDNTTPEGTTAQSTTAEVTTEQTPQIDYNKFLEESSGGLFKSVDEFKASLEKVKEYDGLKTKLEAKETENPFANDMVKQLNELYKQNKTEDQIESFLKLQKLGDLSELDPFEIKVQNLMQKGYKRDVAERKITRDFGLNIATEGEDLTDEEIAENKLRLEDAKEDLRISSIEDLKELEALKVKVQSHDDLAQTKILQEEANKKAYAAKLEHFVNDLASQYEKGVNLKVPVSKEESFDFNFDFDPEFNAAVKTAAKDFFMDVEVNDQTVREFKDEMNKEYLYRNLQTKIAPAIYNHGRSKGVEETVAKYENKSGLPITGQAPVQPDEQKQVNELMRKMAAGEI